MVEMHLTAVRIEIATNTPMVLLREANGRRTLPIMIAVPEATAIELALRGVVPPRPLTHDLMRDAFEALGVSVERVVVTELRGKTFYAEIHLIQEGRRFTISSRPSDAIALAARVGSPIFADDDLIEAEGIELDDVDVDDEDDDDVNPDELVEQFKEFIEDIRPEDFSS